jgi:hypothetical protein
VDWIARSLALIERHGDSPPTELFCGRWEDRHPLNAPGRFYGAATDTCCDGPPLAPASLLYDHEGLGFVWRQPRNDHELTALVEGIRSDPFSGYADDGDQHWTPQLVRDWWADRKSRQPLVEALVRDVAGPRPELPNEHPDLLFRCLPIGGYTQDERAAMRSIVGEYLNYLSSGLARDLQRYIVFLETGSTPTADARLPPL